MYPQSYRERIPIFHEFFTTLSPLGCHFLLAPCAFTPLEVMISILQLT